MAGPLILGNRTLREQEDIQMSLSCQDRVRIPMHVREKHFSELRGDEECLVQGVGPELWIWIRDRMSADSIRIRLPVDEGWIASPCFTQSIHEWTISINRWTPDSHHSVDSVEVHKRDEDDRYVRGRLEVYGSLEVPKP